MKAPQSILQVTIMLLGVSWAGVAQTPSSGGSEFEQSFLQSFPQHHQDAIEMSQLCLQKSTDPDMKQLCQRMISSQTEEKQQMTGWLQSWYGGKGEAPASKMQKMETQHKTMMSKLNADSGKSFDNEFMMDIVQHHKMGIAELQKCQAKAEHQELKSLCDKMMTEQKDDLTKLNSMMHMSM